MPNHVTTICTVTGPKEDVAAFAEVHILPVPDDAPNRRFAFETIIPKPKIVSETTSGSQQEVGLYALTGYRKPRQFGFEPPDDVTDPSLIWRFLPRTVTTRAALLEHLKKHDPAALEQGEKSAQCRKETGYEDWYEWSIANWGTKWGAYDYEERVRMDGRFVFKFETAWSFPEPIFQKLAEKWPTLTFAIISFDEGWNFACDGEFNGQNNYRCQKDLATNEMYERVYGRKPEVDE